MWRSLNDSQCGSRQAMSRERRSDFFKSRMWLYVLRLGLIKKALFVATGCSLLLVYGTFTQTLQDRPTNAMEAFASTHWHSIKEIENFEAIRCDELAARNTSEDALKSARKWAYDPTKQSELLNISKLSLRCEFVKKHYGFNMAALSEEEENFPLAYGMLVHKWADQVFYVMSAVYHPQNAYCIAVDKGSTAAFKQSMQLFQECFPNIHVIIAQKITYCGHSVLAAVTSCLYHLARSPHKWKYYQYLSGVDLPLRTNREMVRIFKRLNGSFNAEVKSFQQSRLKKKKGQKVPYNLKMFKASLSATFSRESANFLAGSKVAAELHRFLRNTYCPDESFWMTMAGNPHVGMPGGLNASRFLHTMQRYTRQDRSADEVEDVTALHYYISRFQSWSGNMWKPCKGKYVSTSCVFGVGDVWSLLQRPQLVAHKFYADFEPAAFFCLFKKVRDRALRGDINRFNDARYGDLPGARITRGESVEQWFNKSSMAGRLRMPEENKV